MEDELDVAAYLASKGYQGKQANGSEVMYPCFFGCQESADSRKKKLYINTEDGWFHCKVCGEAGGTYLLQKHFGDDPKTSVKGGPDPSKRRVVLAKAADLGMQMLENNDEQLIYLLNRGLSYDTIVSRKIGVVTRGWSLSKSLPEEFTKDDIKASGLVYRDGPRAGNDFFYAHLLIPYISRGAVVQMRGRALVEGSGGKYLTPAGDPVLLYGVDDLDDADDVIITEGEFDAMVVKQHLEQASDDKTRRIAVVGLAGANGFKEGFEGYFKNAKRVFIALDPDDTGKREAVKIKEKLGSRARIIELPPELPKCDWTEFLLPIPEFKDNHEEREWTSKHPHAGHTWRDIVGLMGNAQGKRIYSISESAYAWRNQQNNQPGIKTGFTQLDATILPGLKPGQVMIVLAKTGTGKTLFLCNLAYYMRSHKILFITLEMTREEIYERLMKIYLFHRPTASDEEIEFALSNVMICDENRLGENDFPQLVDEFEMEMGCRPDVVFVDYLGYYARGAKGNGQYEKVTNAVMQLKAEAKAGRFVIISPAQVNRLAKEGKPIDIDDARDSGAIEETADFLLSIWRPDDALTITAEAQGNQQPSGKLKMTILKSRHGGKDRTYTLVLDLLTLAIVDDGTAEAKKVQQHNYLLWRGDSWSDLRREETRPVQQALSI